MQNESAGTAPGASAESLHGHALAASLTVKDLQKSLAWYRDVAGFTVNKEHERGGKVRAISLKAGGVEILIGQDDGAKGWDRAKGEGFSLRITTSQDIDALAAAINNSGAAHSTQSQRRCRGGRGCSASRTPTGSRSRSRRRGTQQVTDQRCPAEARRQLCGPRRTAPSRLKARYSSSLNKRDRVRNRTPSGASSEKPPPRPGTTSIVRWVCCQYSNCGPPM